MKRLILTISILLFSSIIFAQTENDSLITAESDSGLVVKNMKEYEVKEGDDWLKTWDMIQPKIEEYFAEEKEEKIEWDEEKGRYKKRKRGYFRAGGGGWDYMVFPINVAEINKNLSSVIGITNFEENMMMHGGGGWAILGKNFRIGGLGVTGYLSSSGMGNNLGKDVDLTYNFAGFLVEKLFHPINKSEISIGAVIGGGDMILNITQENNQPKWSEIWNGFDKTKDSSIPHNFYDYQVEMSNSFFSVYPSIGVRYNILRWCGIGAKIGYMYGNVNGNNWKLNNSKIANVPDMDISNYCFGFSLYFGA